jgi:hypothetical protein
MPLVSFSFDHGWTQGVEEGTKRRFKRTNLNKNAIKISHKRMYPPLK